MNILITEEKRTIMDESATITGNKDRISILKYAIKQINDKIKELEEPEQTAAEDYLDYLDSRY